jgi:uncharacterized phage protein gp47/JayE
VTVTIKSKEQLLGTWVRRIKNNTDITDFQPGGALVTLMEAVAQQVYQAQLSVLKVLEVTEVDNLTETRLDDFAESLKIPNGQGGVGRQAASQATGSVVIGSGFKKILTRAYAGKPAPYAGSKILYVQDASEMFAKTPTNGKIYIGRNTVDSFEGPISYSSISSTGTYWVINLVDPLTKDHSYTDEIVLAQGGDRTINASTTVQVPAYSDAVAIQFTTDAAVILPDGEDSITVSVTCAQFGVVGNVASGAITEFSNPPFAGATVANLLAFINGADTESDASLRQRIKDYPNTLARGTIGAMQSALLTVVDSETKKKVTSASVVRPEEKGIPTKVYIDDGTVLEPVFIGQDYELLLAKASGLEQGFKTAQSPVTPAIVLGTKAAPYVLQAGMTLTFLIDNIPYVYTLTASNYKDITAATAYEVVRDLNSNADGILDFRVIENGTKIVAVDRDTGESAEEIRVIAGDWQDTLGFPTISQRPIYLYKNGILQSFKGQTATISSNVFSTWTVPTSDPVYSGLQVTIDGVSVNVANIQNSDFITRFGVNATEATADNWREVLQAKIPGVTVVFQDNRFIITSNKENSSSSQIVINSGSWIGPASIFSDTLSERSSVGSSKNYTFNRYTGDIRFVSRLQAGDIVEIASQNTRAFVKSTVTPSGLYDVSNDYPGFGPAKFLVTIDGDVTLKTTGSISNGVIEVSAIDVNNRLVSLRDKNNSLLFANAEVGDYLYLTSVKQDGSTPLSGFNSVSDDAVGLYKIKRVVSDINTKDTLVIEVSEHQATTAFVLADEYDTSYLGTAVFKIFSSTAIPQVVTLSSFTTQPVETVVSEINTQLVGAAADRNSGQYFFLRTNTYIDGSISVIATFGKASNILQATSGSSLQSHVASASSAYLDGGFPVVKEVVLPTEPNNGYAARNYLKVIKNYTNVTQTAENPIIEAAANITEYPVGFQETWITGKLLGWTGRVYNNETIAPFEGLLRTDSQIKPIGAVDVLPSYGVNRYSNISFRLQDLAITPSDKFIVQMDLDSTNKTVTLPMYKKALISQEILTSAMGGKGQQFHFKLKDPEDIDSLTSLPKEFFNITSPFVNFDFNDFKVIGKSVGVYKLDTSSASSDQPALVVRSTSFGGTNRIKLNVNYPQSPSQSDIKVSHSNSYDSEEVITSINVEMTSDAVIPSTILTTGGYTVASTSVSGNLRDITLSTEESAITATAVMESLSPSFNLAFAARTPAYEGVLGNNIELVIQDSGKLGAVAETVLMVAQTTKKVTLDLRGSTPDAAALTAALTTSTYLENVTGTGNLSLVPSSSYLYVPEVNAQIANPGYFTIKFNGIDYSPRVRGASGNSWSFQCISVGSGSPVVTINTIAKTIVVNLQGSSLLLSNLQTLLNGATGFNANVISVIDQTAGGYISPFGPSFFTGGVTASNTIETADGVDATNGIFSNGQFLTNNLLQVSGTQSSTSMPIGVWPIVAKPSSATLTIRVPDYTGLSTAVAAATVFDASAYSLRSFAVLPKTLQNLVDAINAYLPDSPVATAQVLGLATTDVLIPNPPQLPRATYINYTNLNPYPTSVMSPATALQYHAFSANRSEGCSIYDYDVAGDIIKATAQSDDAIFPAGTQILNTTYSSVNEEVYLLPTNTATFSRWANFAPASSLPTQASITRAEGATKVQIASKLRGTLGAVYPQNTLTNYYKATILEAASGDNGSAYVSLLLSQTKQLPKNSLVKVTNAVATNLLRPYRVASPLINQTVANTANEKTWVRPNAKILYKKTSATQGRLYFLRNGQSGTVDGIVLPAATEPLTIGTTIQIQANTPSTGLATIKATAGTGTLSARIGDMMYIKPSTPFATQNECPELATGYNSASNGLSAYVGYPVVQVKSSTEIVVIAPNATNESVVTTSTTDLVFVPMLYTEKNIQTNYKAGPHGAEISYNSALVAPFGKHAESIAGQYSYGILKKLSNGFSALVLSNTSDGTNPPNAANDSMLLNECGVNTDDYVFLNGFGEGADGEYQLVAHDGKNTAILYNPLLPIQEVVEDIDEDPTLSGDYGKTWWGKKLLAEGYNPSGSVFTIDPRPIRIVDAESVLPNCKLSIAAAATGTTGWFPQSLIGVWNITKIGLYGPSSDICQYIEFEIPSGTPETSALLANPIVVAAANENNIGFLEKEPFTAFRLVQGWSIDPRNTENAQLYLTPEKSYEKISNSLGTEIECIHKLGYETVPSTGTDGYKIFGGLIREAQRTLDGVPTSISRYPGIKSTGTDVSVLPPIPRSIAITFRVGAREGISINTIATIIRSSITSFISGLGLGQDVILSEVISVVQDIPGVASVQVISTLPEAVDGSIPVADNEKAVVIDPETNINVGQ